MTSHPATTVLAVEAATVSALRDPSMVVAEDVNWTVLAGECWVIAGRQHTGKTDFLMMAGGLMMPPEGSCRLFGRDTREVGEAELAARLRVGCVFENGQLFNHLTIAENIALPLRYHRNLPANVAERETRSLLELLELGPMADVLPSNVSREWMKRAALARALVLQPHLLFCDNPLSGLSPRHRLWWVRFLDRLWDGDGQLERQPMTLIITTEDLLPWKSADRRFALLRDRRFLPLGTWAEMGVSADPVLQELLMVSQEITT